MRLNRSGWWALSISCAIFFLAGVSWVFRLSHIEAEKARLDLADLDSFRSAVKRASELVHPLTGTFNYDSGVYEGGSEAGVADLATTWPSSYPFVVCDVGMDWSGLHLRYEDCMSYSRTSTPYPDSWREGESTVTKDLYADRVRGIRWLVLRTYGIIERHDYSPSGLPGARMDERRLFTDAWVIDLGRMTVCAHRRFDDDPLPEVIDGDYENTMSSKVNREIGTWLQKDTQ